MTLINRAGGLYGIKLTDLVLTDRSTTLSVRDRNFSMSTYEAISLSKQEDCFPSI